MDEKHALLPTKVTGERKYMLVIHGGAGTMDKSRSTPELRAKYKAALKNALLAGYEVLSSGGEAMDAVVAAVSSMEGASGLVTGYRILRLQLCTQSMLTHLV